MLDNQYFKKYLSDRNIDLKEHIQVDRLCTLDIDPKAFEDFANKNRQEATVKSYHPRPFLNSETNEQAINANWIGYNEHNTTETNWGLDPSHNRTLKDMVGRENFRRLGLDPEETLLRLLEYMPGQ
jgi:topoisomerase IA-like protein